MPNDWYGTAEAQYWTVLLQLDLSFAFDPVDSDTTLLESPDSLLIV